MNKYIVGSTVVVIAVVALFYGLNIGEEKLDLNAQVASAVTVENLSHDFGDIDILGGKVSTTYTLKNEGTEDVYITSAITSCMCTEGKIGELQFGMHGSNDKIVVIPAGGEEILTAIYDPLAHGPEGTGAVTRELSLQTNSTITPKILVKFSANVIKK